MKIITVNLPQTYLKVIDDLVGEKALYPSRSELVRVAVRDFLIKELKAAESMQNIAPPPILSMPILPVDPVPAGFENLVTVPGLGTFRLGRK